MLFLKWNSPSCGCTCFPSGKQSRRLIQWACPWHTPNSKIFISFWHSLKSPSGTRFLLHLVGYTYSSPLFTVLLQLLIRDDGDAQTLSAAPVRAGSRPHAGRTDTVGFPQLGAINGPRKSIFCRWGMWIFHTRLSVCRWSGSVHPCCVHPREHARVGRDHYLACLLKPSWGQRGTF